MKQLLAFIYMGLLLHTTAAYATPPCAPSTLEDYVRDIYIPSELIVAGEITDFSADNVSNDQRWTKIKIERLIKGNSTLQEIFIMNWRQHFAGLSDLGSYNKGDKLMLFLKKENNGYHIISPSHCNGGIVNLDSTGQYVEQAWVAGFKGINKMAVDEFISSIQMKLPPPNNK